MAEENVEKTEAPEAPANQTEETSAPAEETVSANQKKKKISQMTLSEVESKIKIVQEKMGGLGSQYAQQLLKRKQVLGG